METLDPEDVELARALDDVSRAVLTASCAGVTEVDHLLTYLPTLTGKGIRPRLSLLAAAIAAPEVPAPVSVAAGIELMHLGTLHHDDVVDEADVRRGQPTVAARWGARAAVFTGTYLLARGTELVAEVGDKAACAAAACVAELWRGQTQELVSAFRVDRRANEYLRVIEQKTGALFGLAALVGGLAASAPPQVGGLLECFGRTYGIAFQLADDLADLSSSSSLLGKPTCADVRAGVYTLPVISALADGGVAGARLRKLIGAPEIPLEDPDEIRALVHEAGGVNYARRVLRGLLDRAHAELERVPQTWATSRLHLLAEDLACVT
jgi:heptaprenyl diphosphate synthase